MAVDLLTAMKNYEVFLPTLQALATMNADTHKVASHYADQNAARSAARIYDNLRQYRVEGTAARQVPPQLLHNQTKTA